MRIPDATTTQRGAALNFRDFVDELLAEGDAVDIAVTVDPHLEAAAVARRVYDTRSPAPLFGSLTGAAPGFRLLGAPAGLSTPPTAYGRLAKHFGLGRNATPRQILEKLVAAMHADPLPPRIVKTGPVKENIATGSDVDLFRFPVPLLHQGDGGRYIGTYGLHVVQTPDGQWTSWSISRSMLLSRNSVVGPAMPQQHLGMIHRMWRDRGEPTPWAFVPGAGYWGSPFGWGFYSPRYIFYGGPVFYGNRGYGARGYAQFRGEGFSGGRVHGMGGGSRGR